MKNIWLLNKINESIEMKRDNRFFLAYNSQTEEALRLSILAKDSQKPIIVVKENNYLANRLYESLSSFFNDEEIVKYLPEESLRAEEIATSFENRAERLLALYKIINNKELKLIITSPYGFIRHLPKYEVLESSIIKLTKDTIITKEELIKKLRELGYEKVNRVEMPMTYATRGYIVDLYSVNYNNPIRIEFFDDVVDSIRLFDINEQTTIETLNDVHIIFAKDVFFSRDQKNYLKNEVEALSGEMEISLEYIENDIFHQSQYFYLAYFDNDHLTDYFNDKDVYLSSIDKINEHLKFIKDETISYIQEMHEEKKLPLKFSVYGDFDRLLQNCSLIKGEPFKEGISKILEVDIPHGNIDYLLKIIEAKDTKYKVISATGKNVEDIINCLIKLNIKYYLFNGELNKGINILVDDISLSFEIPELNFVLYSQNDLFKQRKHIGRFANKYAEATTLNSYEELNNGDYVVHDQYGIGQYVDIETKEVNGISSDYLRIVYKGNDELLVPLSQFSLVRKYVSKDGVVPKLHKLGTKEWVETKKRVEENVEKLAGRLLDLYATREEDIGFAYNKDDELQKEFENDFEYELTKDQANAIDEVKEDMEKAKPMDRLLCGDVGFGKTEVALRAAFKAVNNDKQVAYLCPTTILSLQHYKTFVDRLEKYPVRVELLNRFVSLKKQKEILEDLKLGKVDILIGTHRILSKDIEFKDLGLLIVDEEQRFGVEHKEKVKEMKKTIDVLSLSATPIPRTLQMSLIGIRGLSTLNTAPLNRYPVQTYVVIKNTNLIREVIMRELERNGQVFYLFNNVDQIHLLASRIQKDIPYAKVDVAHGKMSSEEIEDVMYRFYNNETNVLVCTTIVETGIDIPNANTIIVDNAQNFGLSQLYQIKGRVGRSDRVAYAYFLIPESKALNEDAQKRLEAIKEFTTLGSGYKIAMRDLTIRGAGDLLGPKQSGFIDNVGLDLYLSMLQKAIKRKKKEEVKEEETKEKINIPINSSIPESFNDNDYEKLNIYHELDEIDNKEDLLKYYIKIEDEYGKLPKEVEGLFEKKKLELLINLEYIEKITNRNNIFTVTLTKKYSDNIDGVKLFEYCNNLSRDIQISYKQNKLHLFVEAQEEGIDKLLKLVDNLESLRKV